MSPSSPKRYSLNRAHLDALTAPAVLEPVSVTKLAAMIKSGVEQSFPSVRVVGEISSFKVWRSGHCYFDIKDEGAIIPVVMFKPHFARLSFAVADGMQVLLMGRLSVYAAQTRLQLIAEGMEPMGQGALALAFEQLKERLKLAGFFADERKQKIKTLNQTIGLITSSHGAVLRDMVRIIKARNPQANILFMNTRVQGAGAKEEIAYAIEFLDAHALCDVIIVGRGGGSLEDLWAFNEEIVAKAISTAKTPIISAVGHETDTSISDFVADIRAATPTHAAQLATANIVELLDVLTSHHQRLMSMMSGSLKSHALQVAQAKRHLADPRVILYRHSQNIDECANRLKIKLEIIFKRNLAAIKLAKEQLSRHSPHQIVRLRRQWLSDTTSRLVASSPKLKLAEHKNNLRLKNHTLDEQIRTRIIRCRREFEQAVIKLSALSPLAVLKRGFSMVEDADSGRVVMSCAELKPNHRINIVMQDGIVKAQILTGVNRE